VEQRQRHRRSRTAKNRPKSSGKRSCYGSWSFSIACFWNGFHFDDRPRSTWRTGIFSSARSPFDFIDSHTFRSTLVPHRASKFSFFFDQTADELRLCVGRPAIFKPSAHGCETGAVGHSRPTRSDSGRVRAGAVASDGVEIVPAPKTRGGSIHVVAGRAGPGRIGVVPSLPQRARQFGLSRGPGMFRVGRAAEAC